MNPGYVLNGKTYKTVSGLLNAIFKDSKCAECSMVVNNQIRAYGSDRKTVVKLYNVTLPKFGEKQYVTVAK